MADLSQVEAFIRAVSDIIIGPQNFRKGFDPEAAQARQDKNLETADRVAGKAEKLIGVRPQTTSRGRFEGDFREQEMLLRNFEKLSPDDQRRVSSLFFDEVAPETTFEGQRQRRFLRAEKMLELLSESGAFQQEPGGDIESVESAPGFDTSPTRSPGERANRINLDLPAKPGVGGRIKEILGIVPDDELLAELMKRGREDKTGRRPSTLDEPPEFDEDLSFLLRNFTKESI